MLEADSEHMQLSGEPCLSPVGYCHLAGNVNESLKGHVTILSSQQLQHGREHGKTSEFMSMGPSHTSFTVK